MEAGEDAREAGPLPTCVVNKCSCCGKLIVDRPTANKHVATAKCRGATLLKVECGLIELSGAPRTVHVAPGGGVTVVDNRVDNRVHDNTVHIETMVVITGGGKAGDNPFDLVFAGSEQEGELIRKTILENEELRRMIRTVDNAPLAIFQMTKGTRGPQRLRNVKKEGHQVKEFTREGVKTMPIMRYCKDAAVQMMEELQRALDCVTPRSPEAVQQWAADVYDALRAKTHGNACFAEALRLYQTSEARFYKLPDKHAVSETVKHMADAIPRAARF